MERWYCIFKKYKGNRKTINNIPENYDILKFNSYFPTISEEKLKEVIENNKINDYYFDYTSI